MQRELLDAFFARERGFFLTGGAALAGFYLGHRSTDDLDLFATADVSIARGERALRGAAEEIGCTLDSLQESADFRRYAAKRGNQLTVVDLVVDRSPQVFAEKKQHAAIRLDQPEEIAANKLCTLLDRMEVRDLVDLRFLLATGITLEQALAGAREKHAGADAATLTWLLSEFHIPQQHPTLDETGVSAEELESFRQFLIERLARVAFPTPSP